MIIIMYEVIALMIYYVMVTTGNCREGNRVLVNDITEGQLLSYGQKLQRGEQRFI